MESAANSKVFPGFDRVYSFRASTSDRMFIADIDLADGDDFRFLRAEAAPSIPVEARWAMGRKKPSDLIRTTFANPILVSDRVRDILGRFTGWKTYPVTLRGADGGEFVGYHGLAVYGRCGPIDKQKCIPATKQFPGGIFPIWKGLFFDSDSWDGSDIFMPSNNVGSVFVLAEVKQELEKARIKNMDFTRLDEVENHRSFRS